MHFLAISSIIRNFQNQKTQSQLPEGQQEDPRGEDNMSTTSQPAGKNPSEDPAPAKGFLSSFKEGKTPATKSIEDRFSRAGGANHGTAGQWSYQLLHLQVWRFKGRDTDCVIGKLGVASKLGSQEQPRHYQGVGSEKFENDMNNQREQVCFRQMFHVEVDADVAHSQAQLGGSLTRWCMGLRMAGLDARIRTKMSEEGVG